MLHRFRQAQVDQVPQLRLNNYPEWGKPLTVQQYLERESCLERECFAALQAWTLVDAHDSTVLAQCETYKRQVELFQAGKSIYGNADMFGYGIASVFVPMALRGRGYGTQLMKCIKDMVDADDTAVLSHLYSDVGPQFYNRLGWPVYEARGLVLDTGKYRLVSKVSATAADRTVVESLVERQIRIYRDQAIQATLKDPDTVAVIIKPSVATVLWFRERSRILAKYLRPAMQEFFVRPFGHMVAGRSWFVYFHNFKDDILFILHHSVLSVEDAESLLDAAYTEAVSCSLAKVEIWNPSDVFGKCSSMTGVDFVTRTEESLPSLSMSKHANVDASRIVWIGNEKYAWV